MIVVKYLELGMDPYLEVFSNNMIITDITY